MSQNTSFLSCQTGTSTSVKQHKLRKGIALLSVVQGKDKDLISLYLPNTMPLDQAIANLKKDMDCAGKVPHSLQQRFENAQKQLIQLLREQKTLPQNGVAVFAGTVLEGEGGTERLRVEQIIPPQPIIVYLYQVDDHFHLETLREMLRDQKIVGVIALDSKKASFGIQSGGRLEIKESITSGVAGKTSKGGQSQRRYERERDMAVTAFFHRVADHAAKAFLANNVNVLVVGGPGQTKNDFLKGESLHYELANMVLSVVDTQSADKEALKETLDKSAEALHNMCGPEERKVMQNLMMELNKPSVGSATYGLEAVLNVLKAGQARVAIVADDTTYGEVIAVCKKCGYPKSKIANNTLQVTRELVSAPCERCRGTTFEVAERDFVDVLEDLATQTKASVEVISTASEEKTQLKALGGVAALLRYRPA